MKFTKLLCCFPGFSNNHSEKVFKESVEQHFPVDIDKAQRFNAPARPQLNKHISTLIDERLKPQSSNGSTRFSGIRSNPNAGNETQEKEFLVKVEKRRTLFSRIFKRDKAPEQWVERSKNEARLHVLLQSNYRAMRPRSPDRGDSLSANEVLSSQHDQSYGSGRGPKRTFGFGRKPEGAKRQRTAIRLDGSDRDCSVQQFKSAGPDIDSLRAPLLRTSSNSVPVAGTGSTPRSRPKVFSKQTVQGANRQSRSASPRYAGCNLRPTNARGAFEFHDAQDDNGLFSNFWAGDPIEIDGEEWKSVEHYFQAQKFCEKIGDSPFVQQEKRRIRTAIQNARSPGETKWIQAREARQARFPINWKEDWDRPRVQVMYKAVFAKFSQSEALKQALMATGDANLVETMTQGRTDTFWGVIRDPSGEKSTGANMLGQVLAQVRSDLRNQRREIDPYATFETNTRKTW